MILSTLACTISSTGISAPALADIMDTLISQLQSIYGSDILLDPSSQDNQFVLIFATAIFNVNMQTVAVYNAYSPLTAQGANLSSVIKINGLRREIPTNSTVDVNIVGVYGTVIAQGIVQDTSGNLWNLPETVTIDETGSVAVTATAQQQGDIPALPNTVTGRYTPTPGWQSVTNPAAATPGAPVEMDASLRQRQSISTSLPAQTPLDSLEARIANLPGVSRSLTYENVTGATDENGLPAHSISAVVQGGDDTQIATTIANKTPGADTYGTTSLVVEDSQGLPRTIKFFRLAIVTIYVQITILPLPNYEAETAVTIQNAVAAFINALQIGEDVYTAWVSAIASLTSSSATQQTFVVSSVLLSIDNVTFSAGNVNIPFNAAAQTVAANVTITT